MNTRRRRRLHAAAYPSKGKQQENTKRKPDNLHKIIIIMRKRPIFGGHCSHRQNKERLNRNLFFFCLFSSFGLCGKLKEQTQERKNRPECNSRGVEMDLKKKTKKKVNFSRSQRPQRAAKKTSRQDNTSSSSKERDCEKQQRHKLKKENKNDVFLFFLRGVSSQDQKK
jgi:hypothetical protein